MVPLFSPWKDPISRDRVSDLKEKGYDYPAIYMLLYVRGDLKKVQYVGETHCLSVRMKKHDRNWGSKKWNHFTFQSASKYNHKRKQQEEKYIKKYNPPYNDKKTE